MQPLAESLEEPDDEVVGRSLAEWRADVEDWWRHDSLIRTRLPQALFVLIGVIYFVTFERLVWQRHANFGTFDYDLGIYDEAVWLLSRGRGFMTIRGMQVFGHHGNVGFYLLVPFYWLGAGPQFLDFINTLAITITAVPIYLTVRHHLRSEWAALGVGLAYLFHFVPQWLIQETFHPESLSMPFLAAAFYFATTKRWKPYWWSIALTLIWKEDASLAVLMLGVLVALMFAERKRGVITSVAGVVWFLLITKVMLPIGSPGGAVFDTYFGPMGPTASDVVRNSVTNPRLLGRTLSEHGAEGGAMSVLRSHSYVAFGAPWVLLLGLPQHLINFISIQGFTWNPKAHYFTFPYLSAALAGARSVGTKRTPIALLLVVVMLAGVVVTKEQGDGPWTKNSEVGYWPSSMPRHAAINAALAKVPPDAALSTRHYIAPHAAHRPEIYTFPNPWVPSNYGPGGKGTRSPKRVEYLLISTEGLTEDDLAVYAMVTNSGDFKRIYHWGSTGDEVELWKRVKGGRG